MSNSLEHKEKRRLRGVKKLKEARIRRNFSSSLRWKLGLMGLDKKTRESIKSLGLSVKQSLKAAKVILIKRATEAIWKERKALPSTKAILKEEKVNKKGGKK